MNMAGYIVLGIIIGILVLVYVLFLVLYISSAKSYNEAKRVNGVIREDLGDLKLKVGARAIGRPRYRVFHTYLVSFRVDGKDYTKEAELAKCDLKVGDDVELRYSITENEELKPESEALLCWYKEMAIGYTLGIVLGIVLAILKMKDVI